MAKARYMLIGGFLGAGKTTCILRIAERLTEQGLSVGLITNDQSFGLVDTAMLGAHGFAVEEITGGCFCCRFDSLVEASRKLSAESRPDVFLAEPVGSCTDLKATVDYPLRRLYGDDYAVAPLSVVVDPVRALRVLGLEPGPAFSEKVLYIYGKQLEEAEIIVINKSDLLPAKRLETLADALRSRFGSARVVTASARTGAGIDEWIGRLCVDEPRTGGAMEVDYQAYGQGEALLGWLNATVAASAESAFDGNAALARLASRIQRASRGLGLEVAHLKMTLVPDVEAGDIAVVNLVRSDGAPEFSHSLKELLESGRLIINLRAESAPETLRSMVEAALGAEATESPIRFQIERLDAFRPGQPTPVHRLAAV